MKKVFIEAGEKMDSKSKNIVFLMLHIPNPRMNKRIATAKKVGNTSVICVRRAKQDIWQPYHLDVKHYIFEIDLPTAKQPIKRFFNTRSLNKLVKDKLEELCPDVLYCEGIDTLLMAHQYCCKHKKCRIVFEVADLRECFVENKKNLKSKVLAYILTNIEKKCFKKVSNLVITSEKFYEAHFSQLIQKEKTLFLPNIPDPAVFDTYTPKIKGPFTVGFIGGIRYIDQMKMLVDVGETLGINVLFAGAGGSDGDYQKITQYCEGKNFVSFSGKYKYNEEIAQLYSRVNAVYAVYDAANPNVKIALPNKLYESILCELPIIVAKDTYLAQLVESWGVGIAVRYDSKEELKSGIVRLRDDEECSTRIKNACMAKKSIIDFVFQENCLLEIL